MLSQTSIQPNAGQQFRWIRGQWQQQFPSPRDRVAPPTATPRRRRQSLPSRLTKDADTGLTSRHRAILLRSSIQQRLPGPRPTGTAVRFDDVTKRSLSSTAQQPRGVSSPAYQQPNLAHQHPGSVNQEFGQARQPVGQGYNPPSLSAPVLVQRIESPAYRSGDSAYQLPGHAHQPPAVVHQWPADIGRPQQPYPGDTGLTAAVKSQERTYSVQAKQEEEAWSSGVEYGPAWSRTMAAPQSRSEATLTFTQKPQTRGSSSPASQPQTPPLHSADDRSVGGTISASPRPPTSLQPLVRPMEPAGAGPMGGATSVLPRPPTGGQPTQRPSEPAGAGPAQRRDALRQKKMAVIEKSDSVDEDEFDKLVAINYKQLIDAPPTPTGTATLSPPVTADPRKSPKVSPRLTRRLSPAEQAPPTSAAHPTFGAPPSRHSHQLQQTSADNRPELKTEEESEDELSK